MKNCPFCGKTPDMQDPDVCYPSGVAWRYEKDIEMRAYFPLALRQQGDGMCWKFSCTKQSGGCGAEIHADSHAEVLAAWERRA